MSKYSEQIKLWQDPDTYPDPADWDDDVEEETWGGEWEDGDEAVASIVAKGVVSGQAF